jgi:hypothetical protein
MLSDGIESAALCTTGINCPILSKFLSILYATHISSTAALRLIIVTLHSLPPLKRPNSLHRLHRPPRALAVDEMRDPVPGQPPGLGHDEERDEREDRDDAHDDRGICPLALA